MEGGSCRSKSKRRVLSKHRDSDDSDEDFVISDEEEELLEVSEGFYSTLDGDHLEGSFDNLADGEEEGFKEPSETCNSKRKKGAYHQSEGGGEVSRRRGRIAFREKIEDDDGYDDKDGDDEDCDYEVDEDEDEDEDDDCLEDEEETRVGQKESKVKTRNQNLQKRSSARTTKRKNSRMAKKPSGKKRRMNGRSRKKSFLPSSESDFTCSESSDYEYTISEEEREQVREAKDLCENLRIYPRNSSFSTKSGENAHLRPQRKFRSRKVKGKVTEPLSKKGKEKKNELRTEVAKQVCGICLSEENSRKVTGKLNCCTHYFCFSCIMKWAKVESRCPLCKQRFQTITKPARSIAGVDSREVVTQVPQRDQVYQPFEDEFWNSMDPYEGVICSECNEGGDDELMLLCDACDLPAHTFCVGLGRQVPEGSWYCYDCRPAAMSSSSSQAQGSVPEQRRISQAMHTQESARVVAREGIDLNLMTPPLVSVTQIISSLSSPRLQARTIIVPAIVSEGENSTLSGRHWMQNSIGHNLYVSQINGTSVIIQHGRMHSTGTSSLASHSTLQRTGESSYLVGQGVQGSTAVANGRVYGTMWPGIQAPGTRRS